MIVILVLGVVFVAYALITLEEKLNGSDNQEN